jgi:hypothetical protein
MNAVNAEVRRPRRSRLPGTCLGLLIVSVIVGGFIGAVTIFILRAIFSSDAEQAQHPVIIQLSTKLGLLVLLAVTVPLGWYLTRLHWRRWRLRLRGVTADATVMQTRLASRAGEDDLPTYRADIVVSAAGSTGLDSRAAAATWLTVPVPAELVRGQVLRVRYDPDSQPVGGQPARHAYRRPDSGDAAGLGGRHHRVLGVLADHNVGVCCAAGVT